jgi:hypothetical protein
MRFRVYKLGKMNERVYNSEMEFMIVHFSNRRNRFVGGINSMVESFLLRNKSVGVDYQ